MDIRPHINEDIYVCIVLRIYLDNVLFYLCMRKLAWSPYWPYRFVHSTCKKHWSNRLSRIPFLADTQIRVQARAQCACAAHVDGGHLCVTKLIIVRDRYFISVISTSREVRQNIQACYHQKHRNFYRNYAVKIAVQLRAQRAAICCDR